MEEKYIVFESSGGIEKDLMATAVVKNLKIKHPERKIVITSHFPEIWLHNPSVYRVYRIGAAPYFFEEYVDGKDTLIFRHDPFNSNDFVHQKSAENKKHLIEIWSELVGVDYIQKTPELFFTFREREVAKRLTERNKPLFFIECFVGGKNIPYPISWARNLPHDLAESIVLWMNEKGFHTFQIGFNEQPLIQGAERLTLPLRLLLASIEHSHARLFMHGVSEHGAAALQRPSTVFWIANDSRIFGYDLHKNLKIQASKEVEEFIASFGENFDIFSPENERPEIRKEFFDQERIITSLNSEVKPR